MFLSEFSCSVMGFILTSICLLVGLFSPAARASGTFPLSVPTPDPVPGGEQDQLEAPYLHMPVYLHFKKPRVDKRYFAPASVKSRETLPERVRQVLVPAPRRRLKSRIRQDGPVSVACSAKEMRVRVQKAHLGVGGERVHVKLGTCDVSKTSEHSVLFQYELHECDTQRQILNNTVVYSNMLHYIPDVGVSASERFSVPVQCHFNRFHYTYKIGFVPSVARMKFFKPIKSKGSVTLTAYDAQWNRHPPAEGFVVGQPMYFEAETLHVPDGERLYIHFCHVTTDSSRVSTPQVNIIDNYGCLMNSRSSSRSRFINSTRRNVVRFAINAFALQGKVQTFLFLHCDMSIKSVVPTETSKFCTYNRLERRWEELYGADSVCSCCDSSCVPEIPMLMQPLTGKLETLVKQHPEGKSRNIPTESTEGIFTPEPEHEILPTASQHKTSVPERTNTPEHEHRTNPTERTPTMKSKQEIQMPESEHRMNTPENDHGILTPEGDNRKFTLVNTPTPEGDYGMPTAKSDHEMPVAENKHRMPTPEGDHEMPVAEGDHGTPTEEGNHGTPTPEGDLGTVPEGDLGTLMAEMDHGMPTEEGNHGTPTPEGDLGTLTAEGDLGTLTAEMDHGMPTEEGNHGTPTPEGDLGTPTPEGDLGTVTEEGNHGTVTEEGNHGTPTPEGDLGTVTAEGNHGTVTEEGNHGTPTPEGDLGTVTAETDHGMVMAEGDHGKVTPTLEGEHGILIPGKNHETMMPDSEQGILIPEHTWDRDGDDGKVAAETLGTLDSKLGTLPPSVEQHTPAAVNTHTELPEPYLIFEEVFGLE